MRVKWYLLGCVTSVVIVILLLIMTISGIAKLGSSLQQPSPKTADNSVLHLNLVGEIPEYSIMKDMNLDFIGRSSDSVHDIINKILVATNDNKIKAILLEPQSLLVGYANANEITNALKIFKTSGKKVYGYVSIATQQDMYVLGVADEVYMNPSASAGIFMHGVGGNMDFYKDMLDKLGIEMHIIRAGEFKSAGEPYSRSSMSSELRRNITGLYKDRYDQLVSDFAESYEASPEGFKYLFERNEKLYISMGDGKTSKMIDELMFYDDFLKHANITEDQLLKHTKYSPAQPKAQTNKIAVVYMIGSIVQSAPTSIFDNAMTITSKQYNKIFDDIMKDDNIRGVVIRINSGGGSALESEIIHSKIAQLREKKPVVVSMGNVAASGGYYIAANANYIYADPYVVTGSIGVIGMVPNLNGTAKKIGVNTETVGYGKYLSSMSPFTPFSRDFEQGLQKGIMETYHEFKTRVSEGRGIDYFAVEAIAQGQVWSAKKALEYKLIDEIGLMNQAIDKAAEIASASKYSLEYYPKRKTMMDTFKEMNIGLTSFRSIVSQYLQPYETNQTLRQLFNLIDEVKNDPIQMRNEFIPED